MNPEKIHPILREEMEARDRLGPADEGDEKVRDLEGREYPVIVAFEATRGGLEADQMGILGDIGVDIRVDRRLVLFNGVAGRATQDQIEAMSDASRVQMIWYDEPVYAMLDSSLRAIGIPTLWAKGYEGAGVKIAILDTGIDPQHPDVANRVLAMADLTDESDPTDRNGHGTHVASIAAGSGAASNGQYIGVAPKAKLLIGKVLRADGSGRMSMVIAGIEWAVNQGAQVINLSLGARGSSDGNDPTSLMVDRAVEAADTVVVVAAGNEGPAEKTIGAPAAARQAITVGAVEDNGQIADFSSRGPTLDSRVKPDLVLTGVSITAARATGTTLGQPVNERYTTMRGTSMAAPHVTGVVALMLGANPALNPASIKSILMSSTRSLNLPPNAQGNGMLDPTRALAVAVAPLPAPTPDPTPVVPPIPPNPPITPPPTPTPTTERPGCFGQLFKR